jgi:hypothetical protein
VRKGGDSTVCGTRLRASMNCTEKIA